MKNFKNQPLDADLPLATIGITSYNYEKYIEQSLNSVLEQTYRNIEVIIIDDFSQDHCNQIISKWIRENEVNCTYIQHESNRGITRTLNEIVHHAKGEYITFLATDDIMLPERVEKQVNLLEKAGEVYGMCYANALTMDEYGNDLGVYCEMDKENSFYEGFILKKFLKKEITFATPTMLLRTNVFEEVGLFDIRVLIEDFNFFLRLLAIYKVKYTTYPCIVYRQKLYTKSTIHELVKANNKELFFRDRIISNQQAFRFTKDKTIIRILEYNIRKALKHLAINDSKYYFKMLLFLICKFHFIMPLQSLAIKPKLYLYKLVHKH